MVFVSFDRFHVFYSFALRPLFSEFSLLASAAKKLRPVVSIDVVAVTIRNVIPSPNAFIEEKKNEYGIKKTRNGTKITFDLIIYSVSVSFSPSPLTLFLSPTDFDTTFSAQFILIDFIFLVARMNNLNGETAAHSSFWVYWMHFRSVYNSSAKWKKNSFFKHRTEWEVVRRRRRR